MSAVRSLHIAAPIFAACLAVGACSSSSGGAGAGPGTTDPDGGSGVTPASSPDGGSNADSGSGASPNGALRIVSLSSTVTTLTGGKPHPDETDSVGFIVIATDTAGLDTIAGGALVDDAGATYASFGAGANKGTYAATLTFAQMSQTNTIEFPSSGGSRKFTAKFFDNAGNVATASLTLALACRDVEGLSGACAGVCANVTSNAAHCGSCSKVCETGKVCAAGSCVAATLTGGVTACFDYRAVVPDSTCGEICQQAGKTASQYSLDTFSSLGCVPGTGSGGVAPSNVSLSTYMAVGDSFVCNCN